MTEVQAKTQRVVISERFGGFGLSQAAVQWLAERGHKAARFDDWPRDDPRLLAVVDALGAEACSDGFASLAVVEIPAGVKWHVHEYDGYETVHENHRVWTSHGETGCG